MHIDDALIDEQTGAALVRGQIELGEAPALNEHFRLAEHKMILVYFNLFESGDFAIRPLLSFERLKTGFYKTETKGVYLRLPTLNHWFLRDWEPQYAQLTGGCLCHPHVGFGCYHVIRMEVETDFNEEGLTFKIEGALAAEQSRSYQRGVFALRGARTGTPFLVRGTIPWSLLRIFGIGSPRAEGRYLKRPTSLETVDHIALSGENLQDLVIGRNCSYVSGVMRFEAPSDEWSNELTAKILELSFRHDVLHFSSCGPLDKLSNGFYEPAHAARYSTHNLSIWGLGKAQLMRMTRFWFPSRQSTMASQGDNLGLIDFEAAVTRGALQRKISQEIATFDMHAENTDRGVHLTITGTLRPFNEREYELYMETVEDGQPAEVRPWETFSLQADIPRALFIARHAF